LEDKELSAVVIDNTEFVDGELTITWDDVESNDIYYLKLIDDSEQIIFGRELSKDASEFSFGLNDQGWANQNNKAEDGKTYRIELLAILYESGVTFDKAYNIQFISLGSTQIVWGE